jgi:hypothetical protein
MHQLEMEAMLRKNGVYVLGDPDRPHFTMPVVVAGADEATGRAGQMHALVCGGQIPKDVNGLHLSVTVAGGPFTYETCELATRDDEIREVEKELAECELETWKAIVASMLPILQCVASLFPSNSALAIRTKATLQRIEELLIAERITNNISKNFTACM